MTLRELDAIHIGAPVTVVHADETTTGTIIGFGWGASSDEVVTEGRIDMYGGKSVTVPLDKDCITIDA